ncbi:unnamed protein product [Prunus armeniaca]|uniref:NAC domain-containing protein n=1 Tax=Prunus armeniaca TaxID=36596 RepID=A0A6J5U2M1_PRUAR|nr:unnamed protein product [Prunus armeniaca]
MSSISTMEERDSFPVVLPGFRFYPTEEVLVSYYLKKKIEGKDSNFSHIIPEIDVCKHEPCDVPGNPLIFLTSSSLPISSFLLVLCFCLYKFMIMITSVVG